MRTVLTSESFISETFQGTRFSSGAFLDLSLFYHPGDQSLDKKLDQIQRWRYTNEVASIHHLGPMARDFKATFGVGSDEKTITPVDEEGMALAAIQGLNQRLDAKDAQVQDLKARNLKLEQGLTELQQAVQSLSQKK